MTVFAEALEQEFLRLYGRPSFSEAEWEILEHPQRARIIGARTAAIWNLDYRYVITALCKFTDLSRAEALSMYAICEHRQWFERIEAALKERESWK